MRRRWKKAESTPQAPHFVQSDDPPTVESHGLALPLVYERLVLPPTNNVDREVCTRGAGREVLAKPYDGQDEVDLEDLRGRRHHTALV